jgi:hypothetical protein
MIGWRSIDGRVIQVEPMYMGSPDSRWGLFLIKLAILGGAMYYYGPIILVLLVAIIVLAWIVSKILPRGFLTQVAVQVVSFALTRRLMGPIASVPVRDVRIRDATGREMLVRIKGQLVSGSVGVGDDVVMEGWERSGMLLFRRGFNKRISAAIRAKNG